MLEETSPSTASVAGLQSTFLSSTAHISAKASAPAETPSFRWR